MGEGPEVELAWLIPPVTSHPNPKLFLPATQSFMTMKNSTSLPTKIESPARAQLILLITDYRTQVLPKTKFCQSLLWWLMESQKDDGKKKKKKKKNKNRKMENKEKIEKVKEKVKRERGLSTCNTDTFIKSTTCNLYL